LNVLKHLVTFKTRGPEVNDFDLDAVIAFQKHVFRLQVAMNEFGIFYDFHRVKYLTRYQTDQLDGYAFEVVKLDQVEERVLE